MISLEMAQKLKDAGLAWEPKEGDFYYYEYNRIEVKVIHGIPSHEPELYMGFGDHAFFAPSLDQLLAEVGKRGWKWVIYSTTPEITKSTEIYELLEDEKLYHCSVMRDKQEYINGRHTPDDAAAEGLLWIISQKEV